MLEGKHLPLLRLHAALGDSRLEETAKAEAGSAGPDPFHALDSPLSTLDFPRLHSHSLYLWIDQLARIGNVIRYRHDVIQPQQFERSLD